MSDAAVTETEKDGRPTFRLTWDEQEDGVSSPAAVLSTLAHWLRYDQRDPEAAIRYLEAALQLDPEFSGALDEIADTLFDEGRFEEALDYVQKHIALDPDWPFAYATASRIYAEMGDTTQSLAMADRALVLAPSHAHTWRLKARTLITLSRWKELDRMCAEFHPGIARMHEAILLKALAAAHLGQMERARSVYETIPVQARRRFPKYAQEIEALLAPSEAGHMAPSGSPEQPTG